ncbi:CPBP family intramembrane glutamic endopeptidase [Halorussus sp. MSC15.2]|uniref:CPBP family intramembrane glutamic endopeptidase n=1 Tax=Halorussus sp. MSC15.2 TaxID=2283638 RepID=UPI0013D7D393|nr:type II CAAX endopeptidase family protein [Halorussus sp. MSC15.2]NEU57736.1 CPBP family intramembrane metalloprotease [Halorussus sp. MSC15.2]
MRYLQRTDRRKQVEAVLRALYIGTIGFLFTAAGASALQQIFLLAFGPSVFPPSAILSVLFGVLLVVYSLLILRSGFVAVNRPTVRTPSRRELAILGLATGGLLVVSFLVAEFTSYVGIPTSPSSIEQIARTGNPSFLLAFVPISVLFIGPGEELLYRNVIQEHLSATFSDWSAVLLASGIFTAHHLLQYQSATNAQTAMSLLSVFLLSLILGYAYVKTNNILVPALAHGLFDAIVFFHMWLEYS